MVIAARNGQTTSRLNTTKLAQPYGTRSKKQRRTVSLSFTTMPKRCWRICQAWSSHDLREVRDGVTKPYSFSGMQKIVHTMRDKIGLPFTFTLDACRHGGMTELEEAALTDGQGRASSAHKSQQAYDGYAKTNDRAGTVRNAQASRASPERTLPGTEFRNETRNRFRNEESKRDDTAIKAMKGQ